MAGLPVGYTWYTWDLEEEAGVEQQVVVGNSDQYLLFPLPAPVYTIEINLKLTCISRAYDYPTLLEMQGAVKVDLTERVQSLTILKERAYRGEGSILLGNTAAAELTLKLDNTDGAFFSGNDASPYYGRIKPNCRMGSNWDLCCTQVRNTAMQACSTSPVGEVRRARRRPLFVCWTAASCCRANAIKGL